MKLTSYHKEAIIRAITQELPPEPSREDLRKLLTAAAVKLMSVPCKNLYKKNPDALRQITACGVHRNPPTYTVGDADPKQVEAPFKESFAHRNKVLADLKAAINGCSTRKQFIDRFPEFSYHAPSEHGQCSTLPAISNVVADLVKLGLVLRVTQETK